MMRPPAGDARLVKALLAHISEKLPLASGLPASQLPGDGVFQQSVAWVLAQAPARIQDIAAAVLVSLDVIYKSEEAAIDTNNDHLAQSVAQSQLILLRLLLYCLAIHWQSAHHHHHQRSLQDAVGTDKLRASAASLDAAALESRGRPAAAARPRGIRIPALRPPSNASDQQQTQISTDAFAALSPLDDALANEILSHTVRFFFTPAGGVNLDIYSHATSSPNGAPSFGEPSTQDWLAAASTASAGSMSGSIPNFFRHVKFSTPAAIIASILNVRNIRPEDIDRELEHTSALLIYFISASNWSLFLSRFRSRIVAIHPASASSSSAAHRSIANMHNSAPVSDSNQDSPDFNFAELRILECCHLDAHRLSTILGDIGPAIKSFNKKAITILSVSLRRAIWNWIDAFPHEFGNLFQSRHNLDGRPEVIFEYLQANADSTRKKSIFWPTQTMLMLLMAEDIVKYTNSGASVASFAKKIQFLESLKKALRGRGYDPAATLCYADVCRAATFSGKSEGTALRILVGSFETELKEKFFDPKKPLNVVAEEGGILDDRLLSECLASLFKLNPVIILRSLYPSLLDPNSPTLYRVLFIKSCLFLVMEATPLPWNSPIDASLADPIRQLFFEFVGRESATDVKSKRPLLKVQRERLARKMLAEEAERNDIVINALGCWAASPFLAIGRDYFVLPPDELQTLFQLIATCLLDPLEQIRCLAARSLLRIMDPAFIPYWDGCRPDWRHDRDNIPPSESTMRVFWRLSSVVLMTIARQILDVYANPDFDAEIIPESVSLLCDLLSCRNQFLRYRSRSIPAVTGSATQERFAASVSMEIAFLFLLSSPEQDMSRIAVASLLNLVEEVDITGESTDTGGIASTVNTGNQGTSSTHHGSIPENGATGSDVGDDGTTATATATTAAATGGWSASSQHQSTATSSGLGNTRSTSVTGIAANRTSMIMPNSSDTRNSTVSIAQTHRNMFGVNASTGAPHTSFINTPAFSIVQNAAVYRELGMLIENASTGASHAVVLDTKVQQKMIRKALQLMERASPGNLGAWEEVYRRWRVLSNNLIRSIASGGGVGGVGAVAGGSGAPVGGNMTGPNSSIGVSGSQSNSDLIAATGSSPSLAMSNIASNAMPMTATNNKLGARVPNTAATKPSAEVISGLSEDQAEWNNYTGFLCSMGNVCLLANQAVASLAGAGGASAAGTPTSGAPSTPVPGRDATSSPAHSSVPPPAFSGMPIDKSISKLQRINTSHSAEKPRNVPNVAATAVPAEEPTMVNVITSAIVSTDSFNDSYTSGSPHTASVPTTTPSSSQLATWSSFNHAVGTHITLSYSRARTSVDRFIRDLVEMLHYENASIRDVVRDFLINDCSGGLYGILFSHFEKTLTSVFAGGPDFVCSERNTMLVEVMMSVMRSVLDRAEDLYEGNHASDNSGGGLDDRVDAPSGVHASASIIGASIVSGPAAGGGAGAGGAAAASSGGGSAPNDTRSSPAVLLSPYSIDFSWIMIHLIRYLNRLATFPHLAQNISRNKIRFCQLVELLVIKRDIVGIRQDMFFRNHMVGLLLEWNSEFGARSVDQAFSSAEAAARAIVDLDEMTMRVMVPLLDELSLVPVTESGGKLTEVRGDEQDAIKSRLFSTYLTFFLKVLQTCKVVENEVGTGGRGQTATPDSRALVAKSKESVHQLADIKDNTIAALSGLIAANIKAGLKYSLSIAYHEDPRTRAAFMFVLTNILQGGSVSGLLSEDWQETKYSKLLELVTDDDLAIVLTLCEVLSTNDNDDLASTLLGIFERCGKASLLITAVIADEIKHTETAATIFRRNSIATRLLSLYANNEGQDFLFLTLQPTLQSLVSKTSAMSFEVDPSRALSGVNVATNMTNLKQLAQQFLDDIFGNAAAFPPKLRIICDHVYKAVESKFPASGSLGVGAFVFLRYLCPAIVAPERHGLLRQPIPTGELRRGTILVTKIIQNLANFVQFGNKEAFMISANNLLDKNQAGLRAFLSDICASTSVAVGVGEDTSTNNNPSDDLQGYLLQLHRHIVSNFAKMERTVSAAFSEKQIVPNVSKFGTLRDRPDLTQMDAGGDGVVLLKSSLDNLMSPTAGTMPSSVGASVPMIVKRKAAIDQLSVLLVQLGPVPSASEGGGGGSGSNAAGTIGRRARPGQGTGSGTGGSGGNSGSGRGARGNAGGSNNEDTGQNAGSSGGGGMGFGFGGKDAFGRAPVNRAFQDFMRRQSTLPSKDTVVEYVREKRLFYDAGISIEGRPTFVYVSRSFIADSVDMDGLIYVILDIGQEHTSKPFDLVVDLTFFGSENEWATEGLHTIERVMPTEARQNLHTVMFLHPNSYFRVLAKHASRLLHGRMAKRVLFASNLTEFATFATREKLQLPKTTLSIYDQQPTVFSPVNIILSKNAVSPVKLMITSDTLHVLMSKKQDVMGLQPPIVDIFHISDIRDVNIPSADLKNDDTVFFVKLHERYAATAGAITGTNTPILYFSSPRRDGILQAIRAAISRYQLSRPTVATDQRDVSPRDLPGTLLNIALFNLGTDEPTLRVASYDLLCAIISSFAFNTGVRLHAARGISIPANSHRFVINISAKLAESEHALTYEFLSEALLEYPKISGFTLKHYMLRYISPWLPNLVHYVKPAESISNALQTEASRQKLVQIITSLIQLTLKEHDSFFVIQDEIWSVLGRQELLLPTIIDLFVETATQLPFGAPGTEVLANTLISIAGINPQAVSGLIIKAMRDVIASTSRSPRSSMVDHASWRQIQIVLRYILMLSFDDKLCVAANLPEIIHPLTLVAGLGTPIARRTVHGIILNTIQVLSHTPELSETGLVGLQIVLDRLQSQKFSRTFGIDMKQTNSSTATSSSTAVAAASSVRDRLRDYSTPAFVFNNDTIHGESISEVGLEDIGSVVSALVDMTTYGAVNFEISAAWKTRWISLAALTAFEKNLAAQVRSFLIVGALAKDGFDGELLVQTLVALRSALNSFDESRPQLAQAIVVCLCDALHSAPAQENIISCLFWIGIELIQIGYVSLASSGLRLLQVIIRLIEDNSSLRGAKLRRVLLAGRLRLGDSTKKVDNDTLVSFGEYFSFAVSCALLPGLHIASIKADTQSVLKSLIDLSLVQGGGGSGANAAPAVTPTAPSRTSESSNDVTMAAKQGANESETNPTSTEPSSGTSIQTSRGINPAAPVNSSLMGSDDSDFARDTLGYLIPLLIIHNRPESLLVAIGTARGGTELSRTLQHHPSIAYNLVNMAMSENSGVGVLSTASSNIAQPHTNRSSNAFSQTWVDRIMSAIPSNDDTTCIFVSIFLHALLEQSEVESEILNTYRFLGAISERAPNLFLPFYASLYSRLSSTLTSTKSPKMSEAVYFIFQSMAAVPNNETAATAGAREDPRTIARRYGLAGIYAPAANDTKEAKDRRLAIVAQTIESVHSSGPI